MEKSKYSICKDYVRLSQFYYATNISDYEEKRLAILKNIIRQIEHVNYAIPEGSPVESHKPDYVGFTALHFAVLERCEISVKLLLELGADPTLRSRDGYSPLRLAAESSWTSHRRCLDLQGQLKHTVLEMLLSAQVKTGNDVNVSCKNGVSHFHLACMLNHDKAVRFFLTVSGVSVDQAVNKDSPILPGYTALHFAVRYGSVDVVRILLDSKADLTIRDITGITPLQLLVKRNLQLASVISTRDVNKWTIESRKELEANEKILDLFLAKLKRDNTSLGMPELHAVCAKRGVDLEMIEKLLQQGADVNAVMDARSPIYPGYTALHVAAHFNIDTVMLLLKYGADLAAKDVRGNTPFDICVSHFKPEDILCIIESVESLRDISFTDGTKLLDIVLIISDPILIDGKYFRHQVTADSPLWAGYTMLHLAVEFAQRIDHADNILKNYDHYDPSRLAPKGIVDESSKRVVRACTKFIDISTQNASGMTALHLAFRQQKRNLVNLMLDEIYEKGMKANPSDFGNLSHLHIMSVEGRTSIVQPYLNICDEEINLNDTVQTSFQWYTVFSEPSYVRPGSTALHLAVIFQQAGFARLLLQNGADPLATNADGLTPLQLAFVMNSLHEPMRGILLSGLKSKKVNSTSREGLSHFHVACFTNDVILAEEFLTNGLADLEAPIKCGLKDTHKDKPDAIKCSQYYTSQYDCSEYFLPLAPFSGYRALHMAVEGQAVETVKLLLKYGANTQARNTAGLSPLQLALRHIYSDQRSHDIFILLTENATEYDGLTKLHVACLMKDEVGIVKALDAGVDIDARVAEESPMWPGSTALHLLFEDDPITWNVIEPILEQLLRRGANVNLTNCENLTPIHSAYNKNCLPAVKLMLQSSRFLETNPVDDEGLSHFHIACALSENSLVEKFLVGGLADVNCPKDFFSTGSDAGYAPLHFAMIRGKCVTVETLLHHGANILAEDHYRSTALHKIACEMASLDRQIHEDTVLRCINANAKVNAMDIFGRTPLEICLKSNTNHLFLLFLENGARINVVNPISREGLLSNANFFNLDLIVEKAKDIGNIDPDTGFNAIHNIVSGNSLDMDYFDLGETLEKLMEQGCDLDLPDAEGKTPLHVAMHWADSAKTVQILLDLGADINAVDNAGNTPLVYCQCYNKTRGILLCHVNKMSHFGLYISSANKNCLAEISTKYDLNIDILRRHRGHEIPELAKNWDDELEEVRKYTVFRGFNLADLLKEKTITSYPRLSSSKRQAIARSLNFNKLRGRFMSLAGLLRMQHRRALARLPMLDLAKDSLQLCACRALVNFGRLPNLCSEIIIEFLSNEDMQNLINIRE